MTGEHTMPVPATFRAVGDRAARDRAYEHWITGALAPVSDHPRTRRCRVVWLRASTLHAGAQQPAADEWEAGTRYPSFEQLLALAALTHQSPDSFVAREGDEDLDF